jgi:hypothetical protein
MFHAVAGFKVKDNSAGQRNWTAVRLPGRARGMDAPSQREDLALTVARRRLRRGTACNGRNTLSILSPR